MKRALKKDTIKEIRNTFKRFLSILLMAFLGVGFFAGIKATSPDMVETIDAFYREQKVNDLQVISTLGLTNEDLEEVKQIEGVEEVQGSYSADAKIEIENQEIIAKVMTCTPMNQPVLLEGRLPEKEDECVVEKGFLTHMDKQIGDNFVVEIEDTKNDQGESIPFLKQKQVKIVGVVCSPVYISRDRGTSKLGNGKVDYYLYLSPQNMNASEVYTEMNVRIQGTEGLVTSREEYENRVEEVKKNVETIKQKREQARYEALVGKATKQVEKAEKELAQTKQTTHEQLTKAERELSTARQKIQEGEQELKSQEEEANTGLVDAEKKLIEARDEISQIEHPKWYILDRYGNAGYTSFIQDTESVANIGKVFPVVFFVVATLISLTSMTRMVEEQRTQIGTLKALGYNKLQIAGKYIWYASLACLIGGFLGMSVGFVLLPKIIWMMYGMMYQISEIHLRFNWLYGGMGLVLISICIVGATLYAVMMELVHTPAMLMRPKAPKMGKRVLLEKIPLIWKHLRFTQKVTVRNIFRYKKRFLMTIIGILGCTSLILAGFGLRDSIHSILPSQYEKVFHYDQQINLKNNLASQTKEELIHSLEKTEAQERPVILETHMTSGRAISERGEEDVQFIVPSQAEEIDQVIELVDVKTKEKLALGPNDVFLSDKAAQLLGVKEGDIITIEDSHEVKKEVKITHIVENYIYHFVYMAKDLYQTIYEEAYEANVLLTKEVNQSAEEIMQMPQVASVSQISSMVEMIQDTMDSLNYVVIVLIVSAGLLAFVVLYNLANVNISERIRELATIKVLGFYDKEVYSYVTRETVILTMIGIAFGLVAGYFLNSFIIGTCEINMLRFSRTIQPMSYVYSALITIAFTLMVNVATYFSLKKIDMIESLKSVE